MTAQGTQQTLHHSGQRHQNSSKHGQHNEENPWLHHCNPQYARPTACLEERLAIQHAPDLYFEGVPVLLQRYAAIHIPSAELQVLRPGQQCISGKDQAEKKPEPKQSWMAPVCRPGLVPNPSWCTIPKSTE